MGDQKIVFRGGSRTNQALTPRPGKDTIAPEGQKPGVSVEDVLQVLSNAGQNKCQKLDLSKLRAPLAYFPDEVAKGGRPGHGVIAPMDPTGQLDQAALEEWASHRASQGDVPHPLTQLILDAIIENDVRTS